MQIIHTLKGVAIAVLFLVSGANAQCIPDNSPPGWLLQQEDAGGHTIDKHVGWSTEDLFERLDQSTVHAVSTYLGPFDDVGTMIITGLSPQAADINQWAADIGEQGRVDVYFSSPDNFGLVALRQSSGYETVYSDFYLATFMADGSGGCFLLRSYPIWAS